MHCRPTGKASSWSNSRTSASPTRRCAIDHGFRVIDYKVETDTVPPRVCLELSDPVSRTVTDFSPYIKLEPGPVAAVTAENTRVCVEGLKHGERYKVIARKGLPAAVDDEFVKDFEFEFYVRDRRPAVRFAGKSFVLPRTGQNGIPLISVNSKEAKLALYRIGDRNLIDSVLSSDFRAQIDGYRADDIAKRKGRLVWQGAMPTPSPSNEEVTTAFPVDEAIGELEPGLYVMTAKPAAIENEDYDSIATQWFVVSDLGLSTMSGKDGLHVGVRSIASAEAVADAEVRLVARNNEVLATARTARMAPSVLPRASPREPAASRRRWSWPGVRPATTASSISRRPPSISATAAWRAAHRRVRSMPSSIPSAVSTAATRRSIPPCCCATNMPGR